MEEGDLCPECQQGILSLQQEKCYCAATHAPCSSCENSWLACINPSCLYELHPIDKF